MRMATILIVALTALLFVACARYAATAPVASAPSTGAAAGSIGSDLGTLQTADTSADSDVAVSDFSTYDSDLVSLQS